MNGYLFDSNILINSNRYYKQRFFPVIWDFFLCTSPQVYVLDRVFDELCTKNDDLHLWIVNHYKNQTINADQFAKEYSTITDYLFSSGKWKPAGYQIWLNYQHADAWLIACAMNRGYTIITDEDNTGPNGLPTNNEPKIPFVADHFGVKTISFWNFLEQNKFIAR
ncbi:hypothetical protein DMC16_13120 [Lacticaseibacillus paracasei]|uniref:DUF4411 family protein n=1 Tax=Lacticaseibacillus paracasei TaxID=1597 RepID=UPI000D76D6C6|nr:DUF4411 family protein [Lacticaseibacillus paracasei]AWR91990.1 hypothetical protein DMC16_13120 [Lacticaseibacillus paracasei]